MGAKIGLAIKAFFVDGLVCLSEESYIECFEISSGYISLFIFIIFIFVIFVVPLIIYKIIKKNN